MDQEVSFGSNTNSTDTDMNFMQHSDLRMDNASLQTFSPKFEFVPAHSLNASAETKRRGRRRLSTEPSSSRSSPVIKTTLSKKDQTGSSLDVPKRRRRSRILPAEVVEYEGSPFFPKSSPSTRPRLSITRRYSPSPENRIKLKSIAALLQNKAKHERNKMEFSLSQLPSGCDSTSNIFLDCLKKSDVWDFVLHEESDVPFTDAKKETTALPLDASTSTASAPTLPVKEEALSSVSSDEEDEDTDAVPVIRMADIGAAPFTAASFSPLSASFGVRSRKRPRSSLPVIKLPRRKTFGGVRKVKDAEPSPLSLIMKQNVSSNAEASSIKIFERLIPDEKSQVFSGIDAVPDVAGHLVCLKADEVWDFTDRDKSVQMKKLKSTAFPARRRPSNTDFSNLCDRSKRETSAPPDVKKGMFLDVKTAPDATMVCSKQVKVSESANQDNKSSNLRSKAKRQNSVSVQGRLRSDDFAALNTEAEMVLKTAFDVEKSALALERDQLSDFSKQGKSPGAKRLEKKESSGMRGRSKRTKSYIQNQSTSEGSVSAVVETRVIPKIKRASNIRKSVLKFDSDQLLDHSEKEGSPAVKRARKTESSSMPSRLMKADSSSVQNQPSSEDFVSPDLGVQAIPRIEAASGIGESVLSLERDQLRELKSESSAAGRVKRTKSSSMRGISKKTDSFSIQNRPKIKGSASGDVEVREITKDEAVSETRENKPSSDRGQLSELSQLDKDNRLKKTECSSMRDQGGSADSSSMNDQTKSEESSILSRPRRASAGKTLSFITQVTRRRRSSLKTSASCRSTRTSNLQPSSISAASTTESANLDSDSRTPTGQIKTTISSAQKYPGSEMCSSRSIVLPESSRTQEEISEFSYSDTSSVNQTSTRSTSVASTEQTCASEQKEHSPKVENTSSGVKGRGRQRASILRTRGAGRNKIPEAVDRTSPPPTSRSSPSLLNVRRSGRSHVLTTKVRDSSEHPEQPEESHDAWKPAKNVNPNSALGILRRVSRYARPVRSPSPQPLTAISLPKCSEKVTPSSTGPSITSTMESQLKVVGAKTLELSEERESVSGSLEEKISSTAEFTGEQNKDNSEPLRKRSKNSSTLLEEKDHDLIGAVKEDAEPVANLTMEDSFRLLPPPSSDTKIDEAEQLRGSQASVAVISNDVVSVSPLAQGRISSRTVRPSSRFLNADFVSPLRRRKRRGSAVTPQEITVGKGSDSDSATADISEAKPQKSSAVAEGNANLSPGLHTASEATSSVKARAVAVKRSHVMKTRRASDDHPRIKLKIKLGRTPWIKILGATASSTAETEPSMATNESISVKPKTPAKRYISPWSNYIPSVKPVLGNVYYSDGTVEKLGVSVNAVMDRLLAEVCQDGITRHSAIINKREKKKRNIEKARERVHRLKEERAARLAQGYIMTPSKTQNTESSQLNEPEGPRARSVKHRLLQKDFLYPSLKRGAKAEKKKNEEIRRQRSRNVMNQLAESTRAKEASLTPRRGSVTTASKSGIKLREPSPFDPEKEERLRREEEQREKQKRLTMPISFNTFLSSKTSVLTAQPLLQPQRSNERSTAPDHFYRELLCEYNNAGGAVEETWNDFDMDADDGLDVTTIEAVHIPKLDDYVAPPEMDESAEPVAVAIEQMLMRPTVYVEEDGISYLYERALEQSEPRRNLLALAVECISTLHVARLSASGREAAVVVYNVVTAQASKMRDVICMFSREREEAVYWMHRYLIEMLPVELLASYLFLLRHTRLLNCQVKSIVRSTQNDSSPWPEITHIIIKYIEVNVVEPDASELDRTIVPASLSDVIFVLVPPNISVGDFSVRDRHYDPIFKWLRQIGNAASVVVRLKIDETFSTAISDVFFTAVNMISRVVTKVVRENKQKRVVLVGWGTTCCFNHVVLNTVPGVSAIIDLAFPVLTIDGSRGEPDDDILLTYCPTLFVVGSEACDYHPGAMKYMRSNMIMPTGLVVIGHANNHLVVSCSTLSRLRITQRVVNRCIVEQICDFLSMEWTKRERSRLVPMPLNDTFKVDLMQLKIDEKAAQASRKPKDEATLDSRGRKKKLPSTPLPSPIPREPSPSPLPISQLDSVRSNFQTLLKKVGNEKPSKWSEDRQLLSTAFKEPRLPAKSGSAMASPVSGRTDSPNLLDPASISLI